MSAPVLRQSGETQLPESGRSLQRDGAAGTVEDNRVSQGSELAGFGYRCSVAVEGLDLGIGSGLSMEAFEEARHLEADA